MKAGFLFSGIGSFEACAEALGYEIAWSNDNLPFCAKLLKNRFDHPVHDCDIRNFSPGAGSADIVVGGFPCQNVSGLGDGSGILGAKSSLFFELARIVRAVSPRLVLLENSPRLNRRGLEHILLELTQLGYDAEWCSLSAAEFGAYHIRERMFLFAYPNTGGWFGLLHHVKAAIGGHDRAGRPWGGQQEGPPPLATPRDAFLRFEQRFGEPALLGVDDGLAKRLDARNRLSAVGNAVDWRVAHALLKTILETWNHYQNPLRPPSMSSPFPPIGTAPSSTATASPH